MQYFSQRQGLLMRGNVIRVRYLLLITSEHSGPKSFCGTDVFSKSKTHLTCYKWGVLFQEFLDSVGGS